jgi:uncharacterized protein YndB with AHSA1/START domain
MKIIVTILLVFAGVIVLVLLIALFTKKEFSLQKQVTINKPKEEVFNYLKMIRNQEDYSVWVMKDPNIKIVYTGTDGTPGFTSSWQSEDKNVGVGEQEIKKIQEGESMEVEIRFKKPFEGTNWSRTDLHTEANGQTKVTNVFYGKSKFPMNIMNLFMDKMVGEDMQQNLENMKRNIEKQL